MMTKERIAELEEIEALAKDATPGPYTTCEAQAGGVVAPTRADLKQGGGEG